MGEYFWDSEKNKKIAQERGISFEEISFFINRGHLLDIIEHPNASKYQGQKIYVVAVRDYVYLVPFVEMQEGVFLKTIFPSRKMTKKYLQKEG